MKLITRSVSDVDVKKLLKGSAADPIKKVLARIMVGRGATSLSQAYPERKDFLPFTALKGCLEAARLLRDMVVNKDQRPIVILADYDTDGATACAVMLYTLKHYGLNVEYMVPDRQVEGYGLTPAIVDRVHSTYKPAVIITVDNGIASVEGVNRATELNMEVIITDHHLPGPELPKAKAIVNPNQPGCNFPNKSMAGCGVAWYVMWALESLMVPYIQKLNRDFEKRISAIYQSDSSLEEKALQRTAMEGLLPKWAYPSEFSVTELLPFVAIGTIADVVSLKSHHNRVLARVGLRRIREGLTYPGIEFLFKESEHTPRFASASDVGFAVAPRINAAGRLKDMTTGIRCLTAPNNTVAKVLAKDLTLTNRKRKRVEADIMDDAWEALLHEIDPDVRAIAIHQHDAHQGVVGIVAGRIKELFWRPVFVIGEVSEDGYAKASGRSIPGFHLKHAMDDLQAKYPGLLAKYGGHAMAAGMSIEPKNIPLFLKAFTEYAEEHVSDEMLKQVLYTDGNLPFKEITPELIRALKEEAWGQDFPAPIFEGTYQVVSAKAIADGSITEVVLSEGEDTFTCKLYRYRGSLPSGTIRAAFSLDLDSYRNIENPYGILQYFEQAPHIA
jgi:single-stranded-DNA-specific exonuclease